MKLIGGGSFINGVSSFVGPIGLIEMWRSAIKRFRVFTLTYLIDQVKLELLYKQRQCLLTN